MAEALDVFGNTWVLVDGAVSVVPAGTSTSTKVDGPCPGVPTFALQPDFEGYIWAAAGGGLYRLNPRGPGYTDNGLAKRSTAGTEGVDCVGVWDGDETAHQRWFPVPVHSQVTTLSKPQAGDHVEATFEGGDVRAVALDPAGEVQLLPPVSGSSTGAWRTLPGVMPCGNHDIVAAVAKSGSRSLVFVAGGAVWWWGYPASEHMFDELWVFDPELMDSPGAWRVECKLPAPIAFAGLASTADGSKLYCCGGCRNSDGIPNKRSTEKQLWIYDVALRTWEVGPEMLVARQEVVALELSGRIYAFGWDKSCESIGPGDATWRPEAECPLVLGGEGAPTPAGQTAGTALGSTAYFAGPYGLLAFDAATGTWSEQPQPPHSLGRSPLVAAHKGRIYVMGGFHWDSTPGMMCQLPRHLQIFDPSSNTWSEGPPIPSNEAWGAAFSVGDFVCTAGGAHWSRTARTFVFDNRCFALEV